MSDIPFDRSLTPHWQRGYRFQFEPAQKGHVLLYPEGMIKLNESAGLIGELLDGQRPVAEIIEALQARFPDVPELANDVVEFMQVAEHKHWITLD